MALQTQSFAQLLQLMVTQYSAEAPIPANTDAGSALEPIFEAAALLALIIQNELLYIDDVARLVTSSGPDVDSFCTAFGVPRLGASASSGGVTCSTPSPVSAQVVVPVGAIFTTQNGLQFIVVADPDNDAYSASLNGYPIAIGQSSVTVTVNCTAPGSIGNVAANTITEIYGSSTTPMPSPVTTVTNAEAFEDGVDKESDSAYKNRFMLLVSTGRVATGNAILGAVASVQDNLIYSFGDRVWSTGSSTPPSTTTTASASIPAVGSSVTLDAASTTALPYGAFVICYDGTNAFYGQITAIGTGTITVTCIALIAGSGTLANGATILFVGGNGFFTVVVNEANQSEGPSSILLAAVNAAIAAVRGAGISYQVIGPTLVPINGAGTISVDPSYNASEVLEAVQAAFTAFVNGIGLSIDTTPTVCKYFACAAAILAVPGVTDLTGFTLNAGTADITADFGSQLVAGTTTGFVLA